jgi:peroxiredoxin
MLPTGGQTVPARRIDDPMLILRTMRAFVLTISILLPSSTYAGNAAEVAPGFSLFDTNGNNVTLDSYKGKVVFLAFWATWCASCRDELPDLDILHKKFSKNGFTVLSVCVESSASIVTGYLNKYPVSFPVLVDKGGTIADTYRLSGFPASFIIGKDGVIRHKHRGYGKEFLALYETEILDLLKR